MQEINNNKEKDKNNKIGCEEIKQLAVESVFVVFKSIDFTKWDKQRMFKVWDEFHSKVLGASRITNKFNVFIQKLLAMLDVRNVHNYKLLVDIYNMPIDTQEDILEYIRENNTMLILQVRMKNDTLKLEYKQKELEKEMAKDNGNHETFQILSKFN